MVEGRPINLLLVERVGPLGDLEGARRRRRADAAKSEIGFEPRESPDGRSL